MLLDDRWMVVVGGFGMRGVENEVRVCVLRACHLLMSCTYGVAAVVIVRSGNDTSTRPLIYLDSMRFNAQVYVLDTWELPEEEDDKDDQGGEVDDTNNYRQQQPPQRWGRGRLPSLVAAAAAAPPSVAKWWRLADWGQRPFVRIRYPLLFVACSQPSITPPITNQ